MHKNKVAILIKQEFYKFGFKEKELRKYEKFIVDEKYHKYFFRLLEGVLKNNGGHYSKNDLIKTHLNNKLTDDFIINKHHENHVSEVIKKILPFR